MRDCTIVFVSGLMVILGGSLLAAAMKDPQSSKVQTGNNIVLAGVILQTIWFIFFVGCGATFQYRMRHFPTNAVLTYPDIRWQSFLGSLYVVSGLVILRSVFRLVEFAQGHDGYLMRNEAFFYVFDSIPMLVLLVWLNWQHPSEVALLLRRYHGTKAHAQTGELLRALP